MRKIEYVLWSFLLAISLLSDFVSIQPIIIILTFMGVSMFYFFGSAILFNRISIIELSDPNQRKSLSTKRIIGSVLVGMVISLAPVSILFVHFSYPGSVILFFWTTIGLIGSLAAVTYKLKSIKYEPGFYKDVLKRIFIILIISITYFVLKGPQW